MPRQLVESLLLLSCEQLDLPQIDLVLALISLTEAKALLAVALDHQLCLNDSLRRLLELFDLVQTILMVLNQHLF